MEETMKVAAAGALLITCVPLLCLSGCSTSILKSAKYNPAPPVRSITAGYYFLPKMKLRLKAERAAPEVTITRTEKTEKVKDYLQEPNIITNKDTATTIKTETIPYDPDDPEKATVCSLTVEEIVSEPDPEHMYTLDHLRSLWYEDQITVSMTKNGLLTKVDVSAEDKMPAIVTKLGELAKETARATAALVKMLAPDREKALQPFQYTLVVDPTEPTEIGEVNRKLEEVKCNLEISIEPSPVPDYTPEQVNLKQRGAVFFRPGLPYLLKLKTKDTTHHLPNHRNRDQLYESALSNGQGSV